MVIPAVEAGLQRGTLIMPSSERSLSAVAGFSRHEFTRRGGLEAFFHKIVMVRNNAPRFQNDCVQYA